MRIIKEIEECVEETTIACQVIIDWLVNNKTFKQTVKEYENEMPRMPRKRKTTNIQYNKNNTNEE